MTGRHGYHSQQSTQQYIYQLRREHALADSIATSAAELARQAVAHQPVNSGLAGQMQQAQANLARVREELQGLYALARLHHERDMARLENPRKSHRVESAADVGRAIRDN